MKRSYAEAIKRLYMGPGFVFEMNIRVHMNIFTGVIAHMLNMYNQSHCQTFSYFFSQGRREREKKRFHFNSYFFSECMPNGSTPVKKYINLASCVLRSQ